MTWFWSKICQRVEFKNSHIFSLFDINNRMQPPDIWPESSDSVSPELLVAAQNQILQDSSQTKAASKTSFQFVRLRQNFTHGRSYCRDHSSKKKGIKISHHKQFNYGKKCPFKIKFVFKIYECKFDNRRRASLTFLPTNVCTPWILSTGWLV